MARVTPADVRSADPGEAASTLLEALAPLATGKNEDGTDFTLPVSLDALNSGAVNTATATISASGNTLTLPCAGQGSVALALIGSATLSAGNGVFEISTNGGATYALIQGARVDTSAAGTSIGNLSGLTATVPWIWEFGIPAGTTHFRLRLTTSVTGGTLTAVAYSSARFVEPVVTIGGTVSAQLANSTNSIGTVGLATSLLTGTKKAADTGAPAVIKAAAGALVSYCITNLSASTRYVKFFNKATAPVLGTDIPYFVQPIPAGQTVAYEADRGLTFGTGLGWAITVTGTDLATDASAAGEVFGLVTTL